MVIVAVACGGACGGPGNSKDARVGSLSIHEDGGRFHAVLDGPAEKGICFKCKGALIGFATGFVVASDYAWQQERLEAHVKSGTLLGAFAEDERSLRDLVPSMRLCQRAVAFWVEGRRAVSLPEELLDMIDDHLRPLEQLKRVY